MLEYKSPIGIVLSDVQEKYDRWLSDQMIEAVRNVGIRVNKAELEKALQYDRRQFEYGYRSGLLEARGEGRWLALDQFEDGDNVKCSYCNNTCYSPTCLGKPLFQFCPYCGAIMNERKEAEDE